MWLLTVQEGRFLKEFEKLGEIGWVPGKGMDRPAYSASYNEAREYLHTLMNDAGMETRIDGVGNLFGRYDGKEKGAKSFLVGSHLDAVPGGGKYDGALGILAGIEVSRRIREERGPLRHPLEVVAFTAEEGGPLGGTFGSRAFTGLVSRDVPNDILSSFGLSHEVIEKSWGKKEDYLAYLELHIEQGPILWRRNIAIGIPTGIVGITRYKIDICGQANHAGTTPMEERRDAMRSASLLLARWFTWVEQRLREKNDFVCNVGVFSLFPGGAPIVPEKASFILELRSLRDEVVDKVAKTFRSFLEEMPSCRGSMELMVEKPAVELDRNLISAIEIAAQKRGFSHQLIPSGASHDASPMAHFVPTGMIFVPSIEGVSHSKEEATAPKDIICGANTLLETLLELDDKD